MSHSHRFRTSSLRFMYSSRWHLCLYSLRRRHLITIGIPITNLRRSSDRLRFVLGIPIPVRRRLLNEKRPLASIHQADRRLTTRHCKVSKPWDGCYNYLIALKLNRHFGIMMLILRFQSAFVGDITHSIDHWVTPYHHRQPSHTQTQAHTTIIPTITSSRYIVATAS